MLIGLLGLAALAQLLLLIPLPIGVQAAAVLLLAGLLPGALLVETLIGRSAEPPGLTERVVYSVAAGFAVLVTVMLLVSYLPGPATRVHSFVAFDVLLLLLWAIVWRQARMGAPAARSEWADLPAAAKRRLAVGALVLLFVGGTVRFANVGYADYQGDEARAALRAAAVIQGYDDVLLLHKKGPTEILLPAVLYSMTGNLTEGTARAPFALASLAALFAVWLLGWRLFSPLAGWLAAMLVALDGYFIGFARIVQYQSVVLLMSVLAVLILVRLVQRPRALTHYLTLAAIFLATGILSHYEGVLPALPAAWLLGVLLWRNRARRRDIAGATLIAAAVGGALLAVFYVPYIFNPRFAATYTYLTDRRIGGSFPYNNLADVFLRTTLYSTTYYVVGMIVLTVAGMVRAWLRGWSRPLALGLAAAAVALTVVTFVNPSWLTLGGRDWILLPISALLAAVMFAPRMKDEERTLWIWFGAVMVLALFLTEKPRTHVYTFFMPWLLLGGGLLAAGWEWLRARLGSRSATWLGAAAAAGVIVLFANYAFHFFVSRAEVMLNYDEARPAGYWVSYAEPDDKALFGFPLNNGWKVIGELYRNGTLSGSFETTEKEAWVPAWYGGGAERCRRDAQWFFEIRNLEPFSNEDFLSMEHYLRQGFEKWARVQVGGVDKLTIYQRTGTQVEFPTQTDASTLPVYAFEEFAADFDRNAGADLPLTYPSIDPPIPNPLHINMGNQIWLEGYDVSHPTPLRQGDTIRLTLYWRGQQPLSRSYKVFNQVYFGDGPMIAQRDGYPVCDGRESWRWDPGELITDVYDLPVNPDAPDGLYPLYTGMYVEETGERLPVLDESGAEVGSQVQITDIRVGEE